MMPEAFWALWACSILTTREVVSQSRQHCGALEGAKPLENAGSTLLCKTLSELAACTCTLQMVPISFPTSQHAVGNLCECRRGSRWQASGADWAQKGGETDVFTASSEAFSSFARSA